MGLDSFKIPKPTLEASPPTGSGEGIESILDIDSKSNSLVVFSRRGATGRKLVVSDFVRFRRVAEGGTRERRRCDGVGGT